MLVLVGYSKLIFKVVWMYHRNEKEHVERLSPLLHILAE